MSPLAETNEAQITEAQLHPYFEKITRQADRITTGFMVGFFVLGLALSFFHNTFLIALLMGGISLGLFFLVRSMAGGTRMLRLLTSFLYWNFGVQFLLQMHGLYEMKFIFFIALTVLLFYEDWTVFVPATVYALVTLTVLYYFRDSQFVARYFENSQEISLTGLWIHLLSIIFYAALCMWWASMQHAQTRQSAIAALDMEGQLKMMDVNIRFADSISQGNVKIDYGAETPDKLGRSLVNMRESLITAAEREEREKFANLGLARIGEILRQHAENLQMLCDRVVEEIVKYMKANQGSIFVVENQGTKNEFLNLMAARAWDRKKYLQKTIAPGEGLVGQAAIEKHTIFVTQVPHNYVTITSGLGESNPNCILIVPLKSEENVVGVIELASFKVFRDYEIKYLEKVGESIASMIITTRNNQKNKELLQKSNLLTEQMRAQEEEMRQNLEEMQATQEEMHRKNREIERLLHDADQKEIQLQVQLKEIQKIKAESDRKHEEMLEQMKNYRQTLLNILDQLPHKIFLKDSEGRMVLVNTVVAKAHHMSIDELIGKSDFDFVDEATARQWRNQELEIIKKGSETYIFNETLGGESKTLKSTKMAFFIPHLNQIGLLGIQTDITELQMLREQAQESKKLV
ncbi:MAG TPA: GAF domain-containing protein [Chryseosolibacter sp.]|nr:GAF domain-containing protein [Chryseosolibacter sp.]